MPVKKLSDLPQKISSDNGDGFVITSVTGQDMRVPFQNLRENLGVDELEDKASLLQGEIDDLEANQLASTIGFETKALMDTDLAHDAGTIAQVMNDATASNNGYYRKDGGSGTGSWIKRSSLYAETLDPTDTSEAVVGKAVEDFSKTINNHSYVIEKRKFHIENGALKLDNNARILAPSVDTPGLTVAAISSGNHTVSDFAILCYKVDTGTFVNFSWDTGNNSIDNPYTDEIARSKNYIPIAYYDTGGDVRLVGEQRNYESAYIPDVFYRNEDTVGWKTFFVAGHKGSKNNVGISSGSQVLGPRNVLLFDLDTETLIQATWQENTLQGDATQFFFSDSRYRVIAYHRGGPVDSEGEVKLNPLYAISPENKPKYDTQEWVEGCEVTFVDATTVKVAEGYVNGNYVPEVDINLTALGAAVDTNSVVTTLTVGSNYILMQPTGGKRAKFAQNIVVTNNNDVVLTEGDHYEAVTNDNGYTTLNSLGGAVWEDATITYDLPAARIDRIEVDLETGKLYYIEGAEKNYNWAVDYEVTDGRHRLANIFRHWTDDLTSDEVFDCRLYDEYGRTKNELKSISRFPAYFESALAKLKSAMVYKSTQGDSDPIRIAFFGDSTIAGLQEHVTVAGLNENIVGQFVRFLHEEYPNAKISCWKVDANTRNADNTVYPGWGFSNGSQQHIKIYNYAIGAHNIYDLLHDGDGHYDGTGSGQFSLLYDGNERVLHDLVVFGRTNNLVTNTLGGSVASDATVRSTMESAPYNITLSATPYSDIETEMYDTKRIYKALAQRVVDDICDSEVNGVEGKPSLIFVGHTPSRIDLNAGAYQSIDQPYSVWYQNAWHNEVAQENRIPFIDLWPMIQQLVKRTGFDGEMIVASNDWVHPTIYLCKLFAKRLIDVFPENIE